MRSITLDEVGVVSGGEGVTNSEANQIIGAALGEAWHGLTSVEAVIGSALGPAGAALGAWVHYKLQH